MRELLIAALMITSTLGATPEAREWKAPNGTVVKYRWSAPEKTESGKTYPLVLFLHGPASAVMTTRPSSSTE
jgi:predicted peptidase